MEFFLCNKCKTAIKGAIYHNTAVSKALLGKFWNHWSYIPILNFENDCIPRRHKLFGQTNKQQLNNFEPQKPWKYKLFWGLRPDPSCLEKK